MTKPITPAGEPERRSELLDYEALTGLPNRALLADRLAVAVAQGQRYEDLVALVVIDLNKPTEVRAALGLEAGEALTSMVAEHLRQFTRKSDTLAYIGSDLFALVMPRVRSLAQILGLTTHLMKLFDGPWELAGQSLNLVPGIGVSYYPKDGAEPAELVAQAVGAASHAPGRVTVGRTSSIRPGTLRPAIVWRWKATCVAPSRGRSSSCTTSRRSVPKTVASRASRHSCAGSMPSAA